MFQAESCILPCRPRLGSSCLCFLSTWDDRCVTSCPAYWRTFFFFFLWLWGLNSGPSPWTTPPVLFCEGFFKIASHELFAQAGFKPQFSWSLPPEYLGLQAWATVPSL
jgi:hypothetical protein